jgi:hypothetical protein
VGQATSVCSNHSPPVQSCGCPIDVGRGHIKSALRLPLARVNPQLLILASGRSVATSYQEELDTARRLPLDDGVLATGFVLLLG